MKNVSFLLGSSRIFRECIHTGKKPEERFIYESVLSYFTTLKRAKANCFYTFSICGKLTSIKQDGSFKTGLRNGK